MLITTVAATLSTLPLDRAETLLDWLESNGYSARLELCGERWRVVIEERPERKDHEHD
jgi:hypothetical protein